MKWIAVLIAVALIACIIPAAFAEKMWKDGKYVDFEVYTEDDITPGILEAPSWPDVPVDQPGFSQLFNSVPSGPFAALPDMTYSDVREIRGDEEERSWEDVFLPTRPAISIGIQIPAISEPSQGEEGTLMPGFDTPDDHLEFASTFMPIMPYTNYPKVLNPLQAGFQPYQPIPETSYQRPLTLTGKGLLIKFQGITPGEAIAIIRESNPFLTRIVAYDNQVEIFVFTDLSTHDELISALGSNPHVVSITDDMLT